MPMRFNTWGRPGEGNRQCKLKTHQVQSIKRMLREGVPPAEIALKIGTSRATVYDIKAKRTWRHVE